MVWSKDDIKVQPPSSCCQFLFSKSPLFMIFLLMILLLFSYNFFYKNYLSSNRLYKNVNVCLLYKQSLQLCDTLCSYCICYCLEKNVNKKKVPSVKFLYFTLVIVSDSILLSLPKKFKDFASPSIHRFDFYLI